MAEVQNMRAFDSSDEEDEDKTVESPPFTIEWLDLSSYGCTEKLGVSPLPGCRFKDTWRNLKKDLESLQSEEVKNVFVLCTKGELNKYRVTGLLDEMAKAEFIVHHHPFPDGQTPSFPTMIEILEEAKVCLMRGERCLIHCFGGLGRSCLVVACLLMMLDEGLDADTVIEKVKDLRGPSAIQSVKQYNFINDFRENLRELQDSSDTVSRSVSR